MSGTPVNAAGRFQVNFELVPIEEIEIMKNLRPMYFPVLWAEESVSLGKKFTNLLKYQLIL